MGMVEECKGEEDKDDREEKEDKEDKEEDEELLLLEVWMYW